MSSMEELMAEGERLLATGAVDSAAARFSQALAVGEREYGQDHERVIVPLCALAKAAGTHEYDASDRTKLAVGYTERAVAVAELCWRDDKPGQLVALLAYHGECALDRRADR